MLERLRRRGCGVWFMVIACALLALGTNARGQGFLFLGVPNGGGQGNIGRTDPSCRVSGDTIACPHGDVLVQFALFVFGWGDGNGRELGIVQATVDGSSLHNSFFQILPLDYDGARQNGGYAVLETCFLGDSHDIACGISSEGPFGPGQPGVNEPECQADGGLFCTDNSNFVMRCCTPNPAHWTTLSYSWGVAVGPVNPGIGDPGVPAYLGDYVLEVPAGARGEWIIDWMDNIDLTFMRDATGAPIPIGSLLPAILHIWPDCNENDVDDDEELASGASRDCNHNGVPDECEIPPLGPPEGDCNRNGTVDECDITLGGSIDCNGNIVPDECDVADGESGDCNNNGTPDECEIDTDGDGVIDDCDQCAGVDDAAFAPECVGTIPTVSTWGLGILTLLLLVAGKVYFGCRSTVVR